MRFLVPSAAKLNLSLRVTSLRSDGYHNIVSLFLRLSSAEMLAVSRAVGEDRIRVRGMEIEGENILSRALRCARGAGFDVPFLDVEIIKTLNPGSGLGAGSGNGAALLRCLADGADTPSWRDVARQTGSDVPFLFSGFPLALVSGIGEVLELRKSFSFQAWIVFPDWSVETKNAYGALDRRYGEAYPLNEAEARSEADGLWRRLLNGERVGLLPNDFAPELMEKFPDYDKLFALLESAGSCAWGITGSGGAAFGLFRNAASPFSVLWPGRVRQVLSARAG